MHRHLRSAFLVAIAVTLAPTPLLAQLVTRGGTRGEVALTSHTVTATLEDGLARVAVRQVFRHAGLTDVEAVYTFPLPADAALTGLALTVAGERLDGVLSERKRARRVYDDIVRRRRDPALLEQVGDGLFRLSVYPVAPDVDTVIELEYVQRAPLLDGAFRLTVPLGGSGAAPAGRTATTAKSAAHATASATIEVRSTAALGSVSASLPDALVTRAAEGRACVSWEGVAGAAPVAGLSVTAALADGAPTFGVSTYRASDGEGWFVAVYSPGTPRETELLPRDVLLVLDRSGSMQGVKLAQAQDVARWLVDHVRAQDRVNIVSFSTDVTAALPGLTHATADTRAALHGAIDKLVAQGSTALGDALAYVACVPPEEGRARTVVLLTDGRPTFGETKPVALIELARQVGEAGLRLHTFGVGDDVDDGLLRGVATAAGGHAELFVNALEVEPRLRRFLSRTASPALRDLRLTGRGVSLTGLHPRALPDAYLGEQVVVAGRLTGHGPAAFELVGEGPDGVCKVSAITLVPEGAAGSRSVALQYAALRLADLDEARRMRAGLDDAAYRTAAGAWAAIDRGAYATSEELVDEMIRTSLLHGVQCAYTSFIALEAPDRHRVGGEKVGLDAPLDSGQMADSPFDSSSSHSVIGLGGGAGGRYSGRLDGGRNLRAGGGAGTEQALKDGLEWLKKERARSTEPWTLRAEALALLAFQGDGHTLKSGVYQWEASDLTRRLEERVEPTTGAFADPVGASDAGADKALDQLLATLALTEAYALTKLPLLEATVLATLSHAGTLFADTAARAALSSEALIVARELRGAALEAGLADTGLALALDELARRAAEGDAALLVAAARLAGLPEGDDRRALADDVAQRAMAALGPNAGLQGALRLWLVSDALHAVGGPTWTTFNRHRKVVVLDSQLRAGGPEHGSWPVGSGGPGGSSATSPSAGDVRSEALATTAANALTLEASFRLGAGPR